MKYLVIKHALNFRSLDTPFPRSRGQAVLDRYKKRGDQGDNALYVLAPTVRSCLQYQAAYGIGFRERVTTAGVDRALHAQLPCSLERTWRGIPREVVLALLRHW